LKISKDKDDKQNDLYETGRGYL